MTLTKEAGVDHWVPETVLIRLFCFPLTGDYEISDGEMNFLHLDAIDFLK